MDAINARFERLGIEAPDLLKRVRDEAVTIDEAFAMLEARKEKARQEADEAERQKEARGVELRESIESAERASQSIVDQFRAAVDAIIQGRHNIGEAVKVLGEDITPKPLMTKRKFEQLREAFARLMAEFHFQE